MFNPKTLFILGAGASCEANLPTGMQLARDIAPKLNIKFDFSTQVSGDRLIAGALRDQVQPNNDINRYRQGAVVTSAGLPLASSIDDFIETHKSDPYVQVCGKLAIAQSIVEAERNSFVYDPHAEEEVISFDRVADTWFIKFFRVLSTGIPKDELATLFSRVAIINFNYDRCVEHFLISAIRARYGVNNAMANDVMSTLDIIHPYGTVGALPWQGMDEAVGYGELFDHPKKLLMASRRIRTYSEQADEGDILISIRRLVDEAATIVFLGFAFHKQNMNLLRPTNSPGTTKRIFATAKGYSNSDVQAIILRIADMIHGRGNGGYSVENQLTCSELLSHYSLSFSAL